MIVCGVDEAGRGPLAGAVYAAAVVLGDGHGIVGLADSKRLSEARRDELAPQIKARARAWAIAKAESHEIDKLNILQATLLAMRRAVDALGMVPDEVLVDGNRLPKWGYAARAIVKGDALIAEISAASILAKTARDAEMVALHAVHPLYGFDRHKGYPTAEHLQAIQLHGVIAAHRRSFAPVHAVLLQAQASLFD